MARPEDWQTHDGYAHRGCGLPELDPNLMPVSNRSARSRPFDWTRIAG
jgi:hypothetical protein